jgi:hypothetical protein
MRTVLVLLFASACTTLGPTPATTGVSAIPIGRPGIELQAAITPGFHLSESARGDDTNGMGTSQVHAVVEPDRLFGTKGLILGARKWGEGNDSPIEPMIGYRRKLDSMFSVMGLAYGGHARGNEQEASYEAMRAGGELAIDLALQSQSGWIGVHFLASVSATYLDARGEYCVGGDGAAVDCDEGDRRVDGTIEGVYGAGTAGVALDIARRPQGAVQSIRFHLVGTFGRMPMIRDGQQMASDHNYTSVGAGLSFGFGASD